MPARAILTAALVLAMARAHATPPTAADYARRSVAGGPITSLLQDSDTSNLMITDAFSVAAGGTTLASTGLQSLTLFRDNTDLTITGTGDLIFDNDSPAALPLGIDLNGNKGQITLAHVGAITNSGAGKGGVRVDANVSSSVTAINQDSPTSTLYLVSYISVPGAGNAFQATPTFTGPVNLNAGMLFMGATYSVVDSVLVAGPTRALENSGPIVFGGGTLVYATPSSTDLSTKFSSAGTAAYSLDIAGGQSVTLAAPLVGNASKGLRKLGPGTLTLTGASGYSGTTTIGGGTGTLQKIDGGTLQLGNGTSGSLNGTTGTELVFAGSGMFRAAQGPGASQGMLGLSLVRGDAVVEAVRPGSGTTVLSFASLGPRPAGATASFATSGGTNGVDVKVVVGGQAGGFMGHGTFFGGSAYAAYDAAGYVRSLAYGSDANAPAVIPAGATLGTVSATQNLDLTGSITAQRSAAVNTLRINAAANLTLASGTLAVNGVLKAGGSATTIRGGSLRPGAVGGEMVLRTDAATDVLTILSPLVANGTNALTKSGPGTLRLAGGSGLAGDLAVNQGTVVLDMPEARSLPAVAGSGTLAVTGPGPLTLTRPAGLTGGIVVSAGTLVLDYSDASVPASDMVNPAARITFGPDGALPVLSGGGTVVIKAKPTGVTTQNLSIPLPPLSSPGVVTNTGSHKILVDTAGGTATQVVMGKLANVIGNADSGNAQRYTSNGSTLMLGKTAGSGSGDVSFLYATDGRNGLGYGGALGGGRVVSTPDGGTDLDFMAGYDNGSSPYSLIPVGVTGGQYAYTPLTDSSADSGLWYRFQGAQAGVTLGNGGSNGLKIDNPAAGSSITIASTATWRPEGGIILTGTTDFTIQGGSMATSSEKSSRMYVIHQQSTGALEISSVLTDSFVGSQSTSNPIGANGLIKAGPGTLVLSGANTYGGATYLNEGTLRMGSVQNSTTSGPMGGGNGGASSSGIFFNGGTLQWSATNNADYSGRFQTSAGQQFRLDTNGQNVAFLYQLASPGGTLTKLGSGTLTLSRFANTHSGNTRIEGGTLALTAQSTSTIANTPVIELAAATARFNVGAKTAGYTLATDQEIRGIGSVAGTVKLGVGSTLSPGLAGVGRLSFENTLALSAATATPGTGVFRFDLGSPSSAGTTYDQVAVVGALDLAGLSLSHFDFTARAGFGNGTYVLFDAGSLTGGLGTPLTAAVAGADATLALLGNDVVLTVSNYVPEPTSLTLAAAALAAAAVRPRLPRGPYDSARTPGTKDDHICGGPSHG